MLRNNGLNASLKFGNSRNKQARTGVERAMRRAAWMALGGGVILVLPTAAKATETVITQWDFNALGLNAGPDNSPAPSTGTGTAITLGMTNTYNGGNTAADDVLSTSGTATGSYSENLWRIRGAQTPTGNNGWATHAAGAAEYTQGLELDASTVGVTTGIEFSFDWYATTQGIRDLQFQYNTNVSNTSGWVNYDAGPNSSQASAAGTFIATANDYYNANNPPGTITVDLSAIAAASNDPNLGIRLVSAYDSTGNVPNDYAAAKLTGGKTVIYNNNSGNWRFGDLTFFTGSNGGGGAGTTVTWNTTGGTWDVATSNNWINGNPVASQYTEGDAVVFGSQTGATTINVSGTVHPFSTTINNTGAGSYVFTNGSIGGSGPVTIGGGGNVTLSAANSFTGGLTMTGGTLTVNGNDSVLGGATSSVTLAGGATLALTQAINSARAFTVSTTGATINTNGFNLVTSGAGKISGTLNKTGAGNLEVDGALTIGNAAGVLNILQGNVIDGGNGGFSAGDVALNTFNGNFIVTGTPALSWGGTVGGTGSIQIANGGTDTGASHVTGVLITNTSGANASINVPIQLNSNSAAFTPDSITTSTYSPGTFAVTIGGTTHGTEATPGLAINGVISGNSNVEIGNAVGGTGSGSLILQQQNTWKGSTEFDSNAGFVINDKDNALPTTTDVIAGMQYSGQQTWDLNGFSQTIASLSSGPAIIPTGTAPTYLTITNLSGSVANPLLAPTASASTLTFDGSVTPGRPDEDIITDGTAVTGETIAVQKYGSNTITLEANASLNDNFSGGITIGQGTLNLNLVYQPNGVVGSNNNLSMDYLGGTLGVTLQAGGFESGQSLNNATMTHGNDYININDNGGTTAFLQVNSLSRSQSGGVLFASLASAQSYFLLYRPGDPALQNGILPWATVNGTDFGTIVTDPNFPANYDDLVALPSADYSEVVAPILVNSPSSNMKIDGNSPSAVLVGAGTTTVNSILVNDTSAHSLSMASGSTLALNGTGAVFVTANTPSFTIGAPGTTATLTATGGELILISNSTLVDNAAITDDGPVALTTAGTGVTILTGTNTYSGQTEIAGGTLQVGNGGASGVLPAGTIDDRGTLAFGRGDSTSFNNLIQGPGGISQVGSGTTFLTNANTFTGGVAISGGTLSVSSLSAVGTAQPLGEGTGPILLGSASNTGTLQMSGGTLSFPVSIVGAGGTLNSTAGGSTTLTIAGPISTNTGNVTLAGGSMTVSGQITGSSTGSSVTVASGAYAALSNTGNNYTGTTTVQAGGTVNIVAPGALPMGGDVANDGSVLMNANTAAGDFSGTGTTSVTLGVSLKAANFTQGSLVNNGGVTITGSGTVGSALVPGIVGNGALVLGTGTTSNVLTLATNSGGSTLGSLTILGNAALDVNNNHLLVSYSGTAQEAADAASIRTYLTNGYNNGAWNGAGGLDSSAANATVTTASRYALGYADGNDPSELGIVPANTFEIKYTLVGDLNLDGAVSGQDFATLAGHFNSLSLPFWDDGDVNYDGAISGADFAALAGNFGKLDSGASLQLTAADWAAFDSFAQDQAGFGTAVPEPTTASLLAIGGAGLLARRRKRSKMA